MVTPIRPPPKVLLIHDGRGADADAHFNHLIAAGLVVRQARGGVAVDAAIRFQPDIIILDFRSNGEIMSRLKGDPATSRIPVIALAALGDSKSDIDVPN